MYCNDVGASDVDALNEAEEYNLIVIIIYFVVYIMSETTFFDLINKAPTDQVNPPAAL